MERILLARKAAEVAEAHDLFLAGFSKEDIANKMGVSQRTVHNYLRKAEQAHRALMSAKIEMRQEWLMRQNLALQREATTRYIDAKAEEQASEADGPTKQQDSLFWFKERVSIHKTAATMVPQPAPMVTINTEDALIDLKDAWQAMAEREGLVGLPNDSGDEADPSEDAEK